MQSASYYTAIAKMYRPLSAACLDCQNFVPAFCSEKTRSMRLPVGERLLTID